MSCYKFGPSLLLFLSIFALSVARPEINIAPLRQTVFLGSLAHFNCGTVNGPPIWLINGTQYNSTALGPHISNGIVRIRWSQVGADEYFTILQVSTSHRGNNNTEVQCQVRDVESAPALLRVQGILGAPTRLSAVSINISTVLITWLPPFSLDITDSQDILGYTIRFKDFADDLFSVTNEYYYTISSCHFGTVVSVAALNGLGAGYYSEPIIIGHHINTLLGPNSSISATPDMFTCEVICDASLQLTWLIDVALLGHEKNVILSQTRETSNFRLCRENESSTYTESLKVALAEQFASYTVQCVGLCTCGEDMDMSDNCTAKSYYSQTIYIEAESYNTTTVITTQDFTDTHEGMVDNLVFSLGSVASVSTLLCLVLLLSLSGLVCRKCQKHHERTTKELSSPVDTNDIIYEQCGDPGIVVHPAGPALPFPRAEMEKCPAYISTSHPHMNPCGAYVSCS